MDIGKMGNIQPNLPINAHGKAGSTEDPFGKVSDSFVHSDSSSVKQPDLRKAADLLLRKGARPIRDEWSVESNGTPLVISNKNLIIGGFGVQTKALDPKSGEEKWTAEVKGNVVEGKDGTLYAAGSNKTMSALDPDTGREKWSMDFDFDVQIFKVGDDGTVFAKTSNTTYAVDPEKREVIWQCKTLGMPHVGDRGEVIISDGYNDVTRIDPATGKEMWTFNTLGKCNCPPATGKNGDVYACDYLGKMTAIDPDTGKKKWEFETDSSIIDAPLIGPDGDIYVNNCNQHIYAVDPETGKQKWRFDGEGFNNSFASFAPDGSIMFAGGDNLYVLDPKDGTKLWEKKMPGAIPDAPIQGKDGRIYLHCWDKKVHSVRLPGSKDLPMEDTEAETELPDSTDQNHEIKHGDHFVDIGGVRLTVNKTIDS